MTYDFSSRCGPNLFPKCLCNVMQKHEMAKIYHPGYVTDDVCLRTLSIIKAPTQSQSRISNSIFTLAINHSMSIVWGVFALVQSPLELIT